MLKKRDLQDAHILFPLLNDRAVKPYVREKADSLEAYYFLMNRFAQQEDNGELISRTIMDDWGSRLVRLLYMILRIALDFWPHG